MGEGRELKRGPISTFGGASDHFFVDAPSEDPAVSALIHFAVVVVHVSLPRSDPKLIFSAVSDLDLSHKYIMLVKAYVTTYVTTTTTTH